MICLIINHLPIGAKVPPDLSMEPKMDQAGSRGYPPDPKP
jgi:hypothetical protein